MKNIKLINQPDSISCGPTCLQMIADSFKITTTIDELKTICQTDYESGTTGSRMILGLDYIGLDWERFPKQNESAYQKLKQAKLNKNLVLFRTLIGGVKHWILCSFESDELIIFDPASKKKYTLSEEKLDQIWSARQYDGFIIKGQKKLDITAQISFISESEIDQVVHMSSLIFTNVMSYSSNYHYMKNSSVDFQNSVKLTVDGKIIGAYLIRKRNISFSEPGNGIEGFALSIIPAYRKFGFGEMLKEWLENWAIQNNFDYVWGQHLAGLNNKQFWLKRRQLYSEGAGLFKTIKRFKKDSIKLQS